MKYENSFNLPEVIVRAVKRQNAKYSRGNSDWSATQLIDSPQIAVLRSQHYSEMVKDVSDEFWALLGSAVHHILELGAGENEVTEERVFAEVDGAIISGGIDVQKLEDGSFGIRDYKVCQMYALQKEGGYKPEWELQLNIYAYLLKVSKDIAVDQLEILAIIRDWSSGEAKRDPMYPQTPILPLPIPLWPFAKQEAYVKERVALHRKARMLAALDLPLPECTPEERWARPPKWVVKKPDAKRATRVFDTRKEAETFIKGKNGYVIEENPGRNTRCEDGWCGVSAWCQQFRRSRRDRDEEPAPDKLSGGHISTLQAG